MSKPSPAHEIIVHPIAGQVVHQRTRDAYIDARALCEAAGKSFDEYTRWNGKFLEALSAQMRMPVRPKPGIPGFGLIQSVRGGNNPYLRGTWIHPRVAVHVGQWLSVEFQLLLRLMDRQSEWGMFIFAVNQALPKSGRHLPKPPKGPPSDQGSFDL